MLRPTLRLIAAGAAAALVAAAMPGLAQAQAFKGGGAPVAPAAPAAPGGGAGPGGGGFAAPGGGFAGPRGGGMAAPGGGFVGPRSGTVGPRGGFAGERGFAGRPGWRGPHPGTAFAPRYGARPWVHRPGHRYVRPWRPGRRHYYGGIWPYTYGFYDPYYYEPFAYGYYPSYRYYPTRACRYVWVKTKKKRKGKPVYRRVWRCR